MKIESLDNPRVKDAIRARGEEPLPVAVPLTSSELARKSNEMPVTPEDEKSPDPKDEIEHDAADLVAVESAAALHTAFAGGSVRIPVGTARVHVALRPNAKKEVHWSNDAGPVQVWVDVPEGWRIARRLFTLPGPAGAESSTDVRRFDFEVVPPPGPPVEDARLRAYALYFVCEGERGECVYRRRDFEVPIPVPKGGR